MESERRHELETNSLAIWLYRLPDLLRKHANKLLLGAVLLALLVFAIQYRNRSVAQRQMQVREGLSTAWSGVRQLPALALRDMDGEQFVNLRDSIEREALNGIDAVLAEGSSSERRLLASALLAKGQLYWELARLPAPPGATTRPALLTGGRSSEENLKLSEDAYQRVLKEFGDEYDPKMNAMFSLAAIDETRRQLDAAKLKYQQIIDDPKSLPFHRDLARTRLNLLSELSAPLFIGPPSTRQTDLLGPSTGPGTSPATAPASTQPATMPESASPATMPESASPATTPESASPATMPESASPATMPESASPATTPASASPATTPESASPATMPESASPATMPESASPATMPAG
jgi:hypothetical protein